jgi:hypothetical protein
MDSLVRSDENGMLWASPLDVTTLEKGRSYDPEELGLMDLPARETQDFRFLLLKLRDAILHDVDLLGLQVAVRIVDDKIRVMTDGEALWYHKRSAANALAKMGRDARALRRRIDVAALDDTQREDLRVAAARWAMRVLAARRTQRLIEQKKSE